MGEDDDPKPPKSHGRLSIGASLTPRDLVTPTPQLAGVWTARIVTLFPEAFPGTLGLSLTGKALQEGKWQIQPFDLRGFGVGKHRNVDDTPAGGGAGMVLRADVVGRALAVATAGAPTDRARWPVVYASPRGAPFTQKTARRWASADGITLLCGRFEGVDQRVLDQFDVEEVSLGDYVLSGGEVAAQVVLDAALRLRPGVMGDARSGEDESFSAGLLEYPHYTRPAEFEGHSIPEILTSGDHAKVEAWRQEMSEQITRERRPDLWEIYKKKP